MVKKLLIIYVFFVFGCSSRKKLYSSYFLERKDMNFDTSVFKDHENFKSASYVEDDGSKVKSMMFNTGLIISEIIRPGSPFTEIKEYYSNLKLKSIHLF